jgi:hypothetical protein
MAGIDPLPAPNAAPCTQRAPFAGKNKGSIAASTIRNLIMLEAPTAAPQLRSSRAANISDRCADHRPYAFATAQTAAQIGACIKHQPCNLKAFYSNCGAAPAADESVLEMPLQVT